MGKTEKARFGERSSAQRGHNGFEEPVDTSTMQCRYGYMSLNFGGRLNLGVFSVQVAFKTLSLDKRSWWGGCRHRREEPGAVSPKA